MSACDTLATIGALTVLAAFIGAVYLAILLGVIWMIRRDQNRELIERNR